MNFTISDPSTGRTRAAHWTDDTGTGFTNPWPSAKNHPVSLGSATVRIAGGTNV